MPGASAGAQAEVGFLVNYLQTMRCLTGHWVPILAPSLTVRFHRWGYCLQCWKKIEVPHT